MLSLKQDNDLEDGIQLKTGKIRMSNMGTLSALQFSAAIKKKSPRNARNNTKKDVIYVQYRDVKVQRIAQLLPIRMHPVGTKPPRENSKNYPQNSNGGLCPGVGAGLKSAPILG